MDGETIVTVLNQLELSGKLTAAKVGPDKTATFPCPPIELIKMLCFISVSAEDFKMSLYHIGHIAQEHRRSLLPVIFYVCTKISSSLFHCIIRRDGTDF